ncbi:MAG: tetratricopeptide repeat protein, partial [Chthoniobacterales bacterium]
LALRQMNQLDGASQAFQTALLLVPQNTLALDQLVEIKIQQQDFSGALEAVDRQLAQTPDSARTYVSQGKVFVAQQQWEKASSAFRKAVELDPSLTAAYDLLVSSYIASQKVPEAIAQLQELVAKKPDNPSALMLLGAMDERSGDRAKARDAYERAIAVKPDFSQAMNNLACIYIDDNQLDRAADLARKARTLQPNDASIADTLAWAVYKQGDYRQAFGILQEFAPKLEDNPAAQFHLGMAAYMMGQKEVARTALSKSLESTADLPYRKEAEDRLATLKTDGADTQQLPIGELEKQVQQQPNDTVLLMRLADAAEHEKDFAKAADAAERALKVNPKLIAPTLRLARYFAGPLKNKDKALEYAKKARELAPADADVAATLGQVALDSGNYSWAYSLLKESARQRLEDPVLQREYAWAAYDIGKIGEAKETMQRVAALASTGPDAEDAQRFLAFAGGSGDVGDAAPAVSDAQIDDALRTNPTYTPALMARAEQMRKSGDNKGAEKILAEIAGRLPEFAPAQIALADIYVDDPAKITAAADLVAKARKTLPDDSHATEMLAEISFQRKEYPRAIQLFQDARRKRSLSARAMYHLGLSYAETKQPQQATDAINQALAAGLPESVAVTAKQTLADLQKR